MRNIFVKVIPMLLCPVLANAQGIKSQTKPYSLREANPVAEGAVVANDTTVSSSLNDEVPQNIKDVSYSRDYFLKGFQLGVGIGALGGVNAQLGYRIPQKNTNFWKNRFGFRFDYNTWQPLKNKIETYLEDNPVEIDDNEFVGSITGKNYGALVDFYPFGDTWFLGNFRLSGGYYFGDFDLSVSMHKEAGGQFEISDRMYDVEGKADLMASLNYDVKGPYAGVGFDFALLWGLKMYFDAGVVFTKKPVLSTDIKGEGNLSITDKAGNLLYSGPIDVSESEEIQKLLSDTENEYKDELDSITKGIFPMVKFGVLYRF